MARVESQALGGYYATPTELLAPIARLFTVGAGEAFSIVDTCAADGEAVIGIANCIFGEKTLSAGHMRKVTIYACEMEATRYAALHQRQYHCNGATLTAAHGDALRLAWETKEKHGSDKQGCSLFYGNYPYDHDREYRRLEERFAARFIHCVADGGVYCDVRPYQALAASADTLARNLTDLHCYVFPEDKSYSFAKGQVFKQVVLVGTKRPTLAEPDPAVRARVLAWSESADHMPILGSEWSIATIPGHAAYCTGFSRWQVAPLDVVGLLSRVQPWHSTDRSRRCVPIPGVVPAPGDLLARRYPLAVPPKPAHLAAAIASGVFNGAEVVPDDGKPGKRLRVKGTFDKEFVKVEEKQNKDGAKTGEVQVQQPKLVVTVLDCDAGSYHTLTSSAESTGSEDPAVMSTGDLLTRYGRGLMRVMLEQCPVLHDPHDPSHEIALPPLKRTLYRAQQHAVMACVKLISPEFAELRRKWDPRRNGEPENALVLGQIGVGKSSVAAAVYEYMRVKGYADQALTMCPPHLLQSWVDQVAAVTPWVPAPLLESVSDVDAMRSAPQGFYVLSRETAKLSHAYAGISTQCPKCGSPLPVSGDGIRMAAEELARKRVRCEARVSEPSNEIARIADEIALAMMLVAPHSPDVNQRCRGRVRDRMMLRAAERINGIKAWGEAFKSDRAAYERAKPRLAQLTERLALRMLAGDSHLEQPLIGMLAGLADDAFTASIVERVYGASCMAEHNADEIRNWCRDALLLVSADRQPIADRLSALGLSPRPVYYGAKSPWLEWQARSNAEIDPHVHRTGIHMLARLWHKSRLGSPRCVVSVLALLAPLSERTAGRKCNEPLYQAIPEPRRVALAKYMTRRHAPGLFICDEAHEYSTSGDSAQSIAALRVVGTGVPTLALTGSLMNGYAASLYALQQAMDPIFREEFPRQSRVDDEDESKDSGAGLREFCRRYGYIKQLVQQTDKDGKVCEWGSQSERRTTAKEIGYAPGVLSQFILRFLLRVAIPLQMSDLAIDLAPHHEIVEYVEPSDEIRAPYERMLRKLKDQIKEDRFSKDLAGKLFGQMSEIGSCLDRCTTDTGNANDGAYEVRYPENESLGAYSGRVITSADGLSPDTITPKERWMLDTITREHAEGRRVMVFGWHEAVLPRLQKLIEKETGKPCALLLSKVQAKKRQEWIDKHCVAKRIETVVLNPACVKTGLNNLVFYHSVIWMENPAVDPQTYRQATGRINRIGKTLESRSYFPVYNGTVQALAHRLIMHKCAVSMATDGLDAESALQAAGVGTTDATDAMDAMSVGRALFEMLERGEEQRHAETQRPANDVPVAAATVAVPVALSAPVAAPLVRSKRAKVEQLDLFSLMASSKKVA